MSGSPPNQKSDTTNIRRQSGDLSVAREADAAPSVPEPQDLARLNDLLFDDLDKANHFSRDAARRLIRCRAS
jgi:hypothetical protein